MSDVARYVAAGDGVVKTDPAGPLVKWNDYARLQAENERLRNLGIKLDGYVDLVRHENERLRKAGDAMCEVLEEIAKREGLFGFMSAKEWNAAKEDRQP